MTLTPNFFIVGTPKSGTTSLFHYLQEHPEVFLPELKEPHFFSCPEVKNTYYNTKIVESKEEYLNLYETTKTYRAIGDLSSSYLFNKDAARKIHAFNSEAKIIVILRNPVERAISHYLMDVNLGYINIPLTEVLKNKKKHSQFYQEYVELGFYEKQIRIYKDYFLNSQIKIILSNSLFTNTEEAVKEIYDFIGVSSTFSPDFKTKHNQYIEPRFNFFKKIIKSEKLKQITPSILKEKLKPFMFNQEAEKPKLELEKQLLKEIYKESIIKTETLISKDLTSWR